MKSENFPYTYIWIPDRSAATGRPEQIDRKTGRPEDWKTGRPKAQKAKSKLYKSTKAQSTKTQKAGRTEMIKIFFKKISKSY